MALRPVFSPYLDPPRVKLARIIMAGWKLLFGDRAVTLELIEAQALKPYGCRRLPQWPLRRPSGNIDTPLVFMPRDFRIVTPAQPGDGTDEDRPDRILLRRQLEYLYLYNRGGVVELTPHRTDAPFVLVSTS
jgi:hypothetical protein